MADEKKPEGKKPSEVVTGYAAGSIKAGGNRYQFGDILELPAELFLELEANGLVSRNRPLAPGEIRMPAKDAKSVRCVALTRCKFAGKLRHIGEKLDVPVELYVALATTGSIEMLLQPR